MKMIILILKDNDSDAITQALALLHNTRVTRVASTGGFLRSGVVTLLLGVLDERLDAAFSPSHPGEAVDGLPSGERRATIFVVPVEKFEQV